MMTLTYLPANQAFAFLFGDALLRMDGEPMFYQTRPEAVEAAERHGLKVDDDGVVTVSVSLSTGIL